MENPFHMTDNGVIVPKNIIFGDSKPALQVAMWDLYGVIHPDSEALEKLGNKELKGSPTVVSQSMILSALLGGKDIAVIENDIFGPSSGKGLNTALEQVDYGNLDPVSFITHYLQNNGISKKVAETEGKTFIYDYVQGIASSIDRRITDILIPELKNNGVYSQIVTDRTVLALAVAKMVPDYLTPDRFPLGIISSQQVKLHKPDPAIFQKGLDLASFILHSQINPNKAVMIDDRDYNLIGSEKDDFTQGAVNIGMFGIHYSTYEQLVAAFVDLGVPVGLKREV